ncbi:MAG TPA: hypothetical protein DCG75_11405 [Bacteroidales bacterium]|jgi:hypothetical protein|nr:hypothetical protein [Bacteroidales bacterium]
MEKTIKIIAVSLIVLLVFILTILSIKYSPVYVYRLITQNVADVYDYKLYENRNIKSSDNPMIEKPTEFNLILEKVLTSMK